MYLRKDKASVNQRFSLIAPFDKQIIDYHSNGTTNAWKYLKTEPIQTQTSFDIATNPQNENKAFTDRRQQLSNNELLKNSSHVRNHRYVVE